MSARFAGLALLSALIAGGIGYYFGQHRHTAPATAKDGRRVLYYQSPMHPWIKSDKPGNCTICGMALAPVFEGEAGFSAEAGTVVLNKESITVAGIETSKARLAPLVRTMRVNGVFEDNESRHRILAARVPGRIESIAVDEVGRTVTAGQPMATIYSPDVFTASRLYLERLAAGENAFSASARSDARERLLELGLTEQEIKDLETTKQPVALVTVRAPFTGTLLSRQAYVGAYVTDQSPLFELGDLSQLWFWFDAYEPDLVWLKDGLDVVIDLASQPGTPIQAKIAFIDPNLDPMTHTARVRVEVPNVDGRIRHRQTGIASVSLPAGEPVVLVPRSAVIMTKTAPIVYLAMEGSAYKARRVTLGRIGDQDTEIASGLAAGDAIVTQGALLIDAQAQLAMESDPAAQSEMDAHDHMPMPATATKAAVPQSLINALASAAEALASDNLQAYRDNLPALIEATHTSGDLHEKLTPLAAKLTDPQTLKAARDSFEPFSTEVADAVRKMPAKDRGVKIFECPMSPVLGTGRWLQTGSSIRNPFYGSEMLECGEELP